MVTEEALNLVGIGVGFIKKPIDYLYSKVVRAYVEDAPVKLFNKLAGNEVANDIKEANVVVAKYAFIQKMKALKQKQNNIEITGSIPE